MKDLQPIPNDTEVWITTDSQFQEVVSPASRPRSYVVEAQSGCIERNCSQLTIVQRENSENSETPQVNQQPAVETKTPHRMTRSRTGTAVNPPDFKGEM